VSRSYRANPFFSGGPSELECVGAADSPMDVDLLHRDGHCQLRSNRAGARKPPKLGDLLSPASTRAASLHRTLLVHTATCRQMAEQEESMKESNSSRTATESISKRIADLGDWRGETLRRVRALIKEADPDVVEEWKWAKASTPGTPVWSHDGIICTGETYKSVVKLTFAKGASLKDPAKLFNSSLEGSTRRAIDIHEGDKIDEAAFKSLIREAVAVNTAAGAAKSKRAKK